MATKSMDQEHMLLIVILVGALLWMFLKNYKGDVCSLIGGNKETYVVGANWLTDVRNAATSAYGGVHNAVSQEAASLGQAAQSAYKGATGAVQGAIQQGEQAVQGAIQQGGQAVKGLIHKGEGMVVNALETHYPVQTRILCSGINDTCGPPGERSTNTHSLCGSELINMICK